MNADFQRLMTEATRLTQGGDLQAATAAIQAALAGGAPHAGGAMFPDLAGLRERSPVIDVSARVLPDDAPGAADPVSKARGQQAPAGERFVAGRHGSGPSGREFKLYVPPAAGERPLPLVVMLHGCTQNPDDFAAGTAMNEAAREQGFFVLYPAQSQKANPQRCWNWFKHSHQARGRGEPALIAAMTREVMAGHAIDPDRVYVAGLSAGGAMAAILGDAYPELFAAVGVHSGLATGVARDLPSALGAMQSGPAATQRGGMPASGVVTIVFHGDADSTVHPDNGTHLIAASAGGAARPEVERHTAAGGRSYTRRVHRGPGEQVLAEHWLVHGAPHAWSGGSARGSYTDPRGPDASAEMIRFFLEHPRRASH